MKGMNDLRMKSFFRITCMITVIIVVSYIDYCLISFSTIREIKKIQKSVVSKTTDDYLFVINPYEGSDFITLKRDENNVVSTETKQLDNNLKNRENKITIRILKKYGGRIENAAKLFHQDKNLIVAVIAVESSGKERARSNSGAFGLMQIKPSTAITLKEFKKLKNRKEIIKNLYHPYKNILGGTEYLSRLEKMFGSIDAALVAYNIGPTKLNKRIKNGFNPSNHRYVKKVRRILETFN